jgi:Outer membrane protein beta-barrel domain
MQGKNILAAITTAAALTISSATFALMSVPSGWYLEANAGSGKLSNKSYPGSSSSSGIGGNGNIGYKFMPYLAGEIGYSLYPNTSIKNGAGTKAGSDRHYSYDVAAKGILPIAASGAEAFAKAGFSRMVSSVTINNSAAAAGIGLGSSSHSASGLYLGVGMQYYFMPEMAVVAQWQRAQGNSSTGTEDLLSGGVSFIFD